MASVLELRPRAREEFTSSLGMIVFLASWGMMFAGLFFSYAYVRTSAVSWPPIGTPTLPVALPALNTLVMLGSSFTFMRGVSALRKGRRSGLTTWVFVTLVLGAVFLALQLSVWQSVAESGLHITSGLFGSVFYGLTCFHALHVAVGLVILLWVLFRSSRGHYTEHNIMNVSSCAMYWHFVDIVWVLMFVSIYLL